MTPWWRFPCATEVKEFDVSLPKIGSQAESGAAQKSFVVTDKEAKRRVETRQVP